MVPFSFGCGSAVLAAIATLAPSRAARSAIARPMPRLHHQWLPDEVRVEHGFPEDVLTALRDKGHKLLEPMGPTSANSILVTANGLLGAPDPRTRGADAAGQ